MQIYSTVALVSTQEASKKRAIFQKKKKTTLEYTKNCLKHLEKITKTHRKDVDP